ncbi:carbonate dehydratase NCE103 Ecym_3313 [Eremothecium cymbalariae DBVPG|uniref:Carbonic anhydrase n=1 Tax=Eremothecium cymbalariae (strain CBS 270.75 / DBVPG 7215 / KCTC 17166 / NRRL Y-17582) TaxID=931890 RepID=G8JRN5_ERECY|nr:Hypothetical protein Ecym_3313 [Eremothecium cymbalariae DBVPG\
MTYTTSALPFSLSADSNIKDILEANAKWRKRMQDQFPTLFGLNAQGQSPHTLFIGCCDSRYNETCLGVIPGEAFTYRSIANIIDPADTGYLAIIEFAVNVMKVNKVVICGHTDCGGIKTCLMHKDPTASAASPPKLSTNNITKHLQDIDDLYYEHKDAIVSLDADKQILHLAIANVRKQYLKILQNPTVQSAVQQSRLQVYTMLYHVDSGALQVVNT